MNYKKIQRLSIGILILAVAGSFSLGVFSIILGISAGIQNAVDWIAVLVVLFFGFVNIILRDHEESEEELFYDDCLIEHIERKEI